MGTRIPTHMVAEYMWHDGYSDLTYGYDLTRGQVLVACWYEAEHGTYRKQWSAWVEEHFTKMWHANWKAVPNPPSKDRAARISTGLSE